jgi:hypothetical protein
MVLIGLVLLILIAKEILVFNAESLVLISFVLFVSVLFSLSENVVGFFNDRVDSLKKEFFSQRALRILHLKNYSKYLERKKEVLDLVKKDLAFYLSLKHGLLQYAHLSLEVRVYNATIEKLRRIASLDKNAYDNLFNEINRILPGLVREDFNNNASAREEALANSIEALASAGKQ